MTPQEIFDKAYLGLKAQGRRSTHRGVCRYNGAGDTHCGIGFLVPPAVGEAWDEHSAGGIHFLVTTQHEGTKPWMRKHLSLLCAIQSSHDLIKDWEQDFEANFAAVAKEFGLEVPK